MVDLTALALGASPALGAGLPTPPLRPTEGLKSLSRTGDLRSGITTWSGRPAPSAEYLLALLMIAAGVNHFVHPDFYDRIMPPYLPLHRELALLSGAIEIALGMLLLVPRLTRLAAWGIIALLIAVFPANIYLYQNQEILPAPPILHLLRLPMQGVFDPVGVVAYAGGELNEQWADFELHSGSSPRSSRIAGTPISTSPCCR